MMNKIDIHFAAPQCTCGYTLVWPEPERVFRGFRYRLRCCGCNKSKGFANETQKALINARIAYLEQKEGH